MKWPSLVWTVFWNLIAGNLIAGILVFLLQIPRSYQSDAFVAGALIGAAAGLLRWRKRYAPFESEIHGSARFADQRRARRTLGGLEGLIIGRAESGWLMRYDGPSHLLTIAPTRSGKGVGAIIPNLLTADRGVLCIDPKDENAAITARARSQFGPVHVLDPFGVSGCARAQYNPLALLHPESVDLAEDSALVAEALVADPPHQVADAHWNEEAKALIAGLVMHVVTCGEANAATLSRVRLLLTLPQERWDELLRQMQVSSGAGGLVARAANRHLSKADREAAGVLSSAQRHTHFLDSPRMANLTARSDFTLMDIRDQRASLFLVLPPDRYATHARWLRLVISQTISAVLQSAVPNDAAPVLLLLDEFAALGRLQAVERAFGLMAGYGLQLWPILQDLHQLRSVYGAAAGTFLSNSGVIQLFNVADIETASWVSKSLGPMTEAYASPSHSLTTSSGRHGSVSRGVSSSLHLVRRDLMTPDEIMRMDHDRLLILRPGFAPLAARKVRHFEDREFSGLFDVHRA